MDSCSDQDIEKDFCTIILAHDYNYMCHPEVGSVAATYVIVMIWRDRMTNNMTPQHPYLWLYDASISELSSLPPLTMLYNYIINCLCMCKSNEQNKIKIHSCFIINCEKPHLHYLPIQTWTGYCIGGYIMKTKWPYILPFVL